MRRDRSSALGLSAAAVAVATGAAYLRVIASQGEADWERVAAVASLIGAGALAAGIGTRLQGLSRAVTLSVAGTDLLVMGLLGIFSVGLPLLLASGLALAAAVRSAAIVQRRGTFVLGVVTGSFPLVAAIVLAAVA